MTTAHGAVILVVDDDPGICLVVRRNLEALGFVVHVMDHGSGVIDEVLRTRPDIVLLDLALPDASGLDVLAHLREVSDVQVIVLSALTDEQTVVDALGGGADDYLAKPFRIAELQMRVQVALRHAAKRTLEPVLTAGPLRVDLGSHEVTIHGKPVELTPHEFNLCRVLIEQMDRVVTSKAILATVWGQDRGTDSHLVRTFVSQLRAKLGDDVQIVNHPGIGYRLVPPSEPFKREAHSVEQ